MKQSIPQAELKVYRRKDCAVFLKTKEQYGSLSNMAGGFPIVVDKIMWRTSEALYQACRFPDHPLIQRAINSEASPISAKMVGRKHIKNTREDWEDVKVKIMKWCLHLKLAHNFDKFSRCLLQTVPLDIVEQSWKDTFWGAKPINPFQLEGRNMLGLLLMDLREELTLFPKQKMLRVDPPVGVPNLIIDRKRVRTIGGRSPDMGLIRHKGRNSL